MDAAVELTLKYICDRYERCYELLPYAREALLQFDGVVGIGIGPKQSGNTLDPEQTCFMVYVEEKKHAAALSANQFIPREFSGIKTDVVQVGSRRVDSHNQLDSRWLSQDESILSDRAGANTAVVSSISL